MEEQEYKTMWYLESEWDLGFNLPGGHHGIYHSKQQAYEVAKELYWEDANFDEVWGDLISVQEVDIEVEC